MKKRMTIGEYAKLRQVSTETLRHYDRIDLFKPIEIDPKNGYRYYSVTQDEKLGTIRELQHLGMSITEIKAYFDDRNLSQSLSLLKEVSRKLKDRISSLQALEINLSRRIKHLEKVSKKDDFESVKVKDFQERLIIHKNEKISDDVGFSYALIELEKALMESTPLIASNRIGVLIDQNAIDFKNVIPFIFVNEENKIDSQLIHIIPKGKYACKYHQGDYRGGIKEIESMKKWLSARNFVISGPILQITQVDISVTDRIEEGLFEIQIPIKEA